MIERPQHPTGEPGNLTRRAALQHDLALALKGAVGAGALPHLIDTKPVLRRMAGLGEVHDRSDGYTIRRAIEVGISRVEDGYRSLHGAEVAAQGYKWGALTLLRYLHSAKSAPARRGLVLARLGLGYTLDTWRRQPEVDFFLHLAQYLI